MRYEQPVFNFLVSMLRHSQDAEDALQATWINAWKALPGYAERQRFESWLYTIARREALMTLRRRKRSREAATDPVRLAEASPVSEPGGGAEGVWTERQQRLFEAVERLPVPEREVVWLRLKAELSFAEIARMTEAPLNTVLSRMRRATLRLRRELNPEAEE